MFHIYHDQVYHAKNVLPRGQLFWGFWFYWSYTDERIKENYNSSNKINGPMFVGILRPKEDIDYFV